MGNTESFFKDADTLLETIISSIEKSDKDRWKDSRFENIKKLKTKKLGEQFAEVLVAQRYKQKGLDVEFLPKLTNVPLNERIGDLLIEGDTSIQLEVKAATQKQIPDNRFNFNYINWEGKWDHLCLFFIFPNEIKISVIPKLEAKNLMDPSASNKLQGSWGKFSKWELPY